jgi:hypothetical protein
MGTSHQFNENSDNSSNTFLFIMGICVPIVNHYSYENQNSIPMQISPIVLTLASTSDLRQNTKRRNVHQCTKINDKLIWRENRLKKGCHLPNHNLINNARLNLKLLQ